MNSLITNKALKSFKKHHLTSLYFINYRYSHNNNNGSGENSHSEKNYKKKCHTPKYLFSSVIPFLILLKQQAKDWFEDLKRPQPIYINGADPSYKIKVASSLLQSSSSFSSSSSSSSESYDELQNEWNQQQLKYQREIEKLERENRELKRVLFNNQQHHSHVKTSLVDMYARVLDSLNNYHHHANYKNNNVATNKMNNNEKNQKNDDSKGWEDQLARVVVVGDQSAGKTSVIESLLQARIFPRGSGEMMTRAAVQVVMSEGPEHVAILKNNKNNNKDNKKNNKDNKYNEDLLYNLSKEEDCESLRREIERRMKASVAAGDTISQKVISLRVQGPGLQRMVLVDLPGIISTVTKDLKADTKSTIEKLCLQHISNPNSIILCVQDGSLDAERSNVTELVRKVDEGGKRSIFVLTKVDLAEKNRLNPERLRKTLDGKLFPMKALAYFAVVTGRGNAEESMASIRQYEESFFKQSTLFKQGTLKSNECGSVNLGLEVSSLFWKLVCQSVQSQLDLLKGVKYNLEAEWKNKYPKHREMDRGELFEKSKEEILDELLSLSNLPAKYWEGHLLNNLWSDVMEFVFEELYLPAVEEEEEGAFNTRIDIKLKHWVDKILPQRSLQVGQTTLEEEFYKLLTYSPLPPSSTTKTKNKNDDVFDALKKAIFWEVKNRMSYVDHQSENTLKVLQLSTFEDRSVQSKEQWDAAVDFMKRVLLMKKEEGDKAAEELFGSASWWHWFGGSNLSEEQSLRRAIRKQLERITSTKSKSKLNQDEIVTLKKNLQTSNNVDITEEMLEETWTHMHRNNFIQKGLLTANDCAKEFYYYQQGFKDNSIDCSDVILFWRVERMLSTTARALRQHLLNHQNRKMEVVLKGVLQEFAGDEALLHKYLAGDRVHLAQHIKHVRTVIDQLEEFLHELSKAKS